MSCRTVGHEQVPVELTLDLQPAPYEGDIFDVIIRLEFDFASGKEELQVSPFPFDKPMLDQSIDYLVELIEKPEGRVDLWDDEDSYLSFRKTATRPDIIILSGSSSARRPYGDFYGDDDDDDLLSKVLAKWQGGIAAQGILLTNAETARLAQELQDFLASGD